MQFDPLPAETRVALRRATASVVDDVKKWVGADVVNNVLAVHRMSDLRMPTVVVAPANNQGHP
jgi:hypothetical protein